MTNQDFAPDAFELEVIKCVSEKAKVVIEYDRLCAGCERKRYFIVINDRPDYLCLTCRLAS